MHVYAARRNGVRKEIPLRKLESREGYAPIGFGPEYMVEADDRTAIFSGLMSRATRAFFEMDDRRETRGSARKRGARPAAFVDELSGCLRIAYKEIMIRFRKGTSAAIRRALLGDRGFRTRPRRSKYAPRDQFVVYDPNVKCFGEELIEVANEWAERDEVVFAAPNFVSGYTLATLPAIHAEQWHLWNRATYQGQVRDEDIRVRGAWNQTTGKSSIVIAILDDGVDGLHENLRLRIESGKGRDFCVPETDPDHYNANPKCFRYPFYGLAGNDIHGTLCAGVAASSGSKQNVRGAAPGCRILPIKIFHADQMASDAQVANAIRYASQNAAIISCSWTAPWSPDVETAIQEDAAEGRGGKGTAVFCAAGNDNPQGVEFPAAMPETIAVGASTDQGLHAGYSNSGPELSLVAPSGGGVRGIFTTDVSAANRGRNVGNPSAGGADGLHYNDFSGTSAATPLAASVGALVLSVYPDLDREELKTLLQDTAQKIGGPYDGNGHSPILGYGRVDAEAAVQAALAKKQAAPGAARRSKSGRRSARAARSRK